MTLSNLSPTALLAWASRRLAGVRRGFEGPESWEKRRTCLMLMISRVCDGGREQMRCAEPQGARAQVSRIQLPPIEMVGVGLEGQMLFVLASCFRLPQNVDAIRRRCIDFEREACVHGLELLIGRQHLAIPTVFSLSARLFIHTERLVVLGEIFCFAQMVLVRRNQPKELAA